MIFSNFISSIKDRRDSLVTIQSHWLVLSLDNNECSVNYLSETFCYVLMNQDLTKLLIIHGTRFFLWHLQKLVPDEGWPNCIYQSSCMQIQSDTLISTFCTRYINNDVRNQSIITFDVPFDLCYPPDWPKLNSLDFGPKRRASQGTWKAAIGYRWIQVVQQFIPVQESHLQCHI